MNEAYIVSAVRTPIGSFGGGLSTIPATRLGAAAIAEALKRAGLHGNQVEELFFGNVISAGLGQAPATQVAIHGGLGDRVPSTLINKVCASGLKAVMLAAQSIQLGHQQVVVAGGMENMSSIPYYLTKARYGYRYGNGELIDGLTHDALTDAYNHCAMGVCADDTAKELGITRVQQDEFAIESYKRAAAAWEEGRFNDEVIGVPVPGKKGDVTLVSKDEEYRNVQFEKIPALKPVFTPEGTVTAANASTLNDGAAALVIMDGAKIKELGIRPLARILGYADAAHDPMRFTTAPALAIPKALTNAGINAAAVDYYEINEAFSAVALANMKMLSLDPSKVNVNGGAVALGHPLGASGARILVTLVHVLKQRNARIGVAGICNGGGGASALVIENC